MIQYKGVSNPVRFNTFSRMKYRTPFESQNWTIVTPFGKDIVSNKNISLNK